MHSTLEALHLILLLLVKKIKPGSNNNAVKI